MDGPQRLAQVFVELADTLVEDFDVVDFLHILTDRCVELLDADAAGLMLSDQRGGLTLMAVTMERARLLELFELQVEEGPCIDCFATGRAVTNVDAAEARRRWPTFSAGAANAGFGATQALPMRLRRQVIGALNLFSNRPALLDDDDLAVGQAMADVATIGLLQERSITEQTVLSEQLQNALSSRVVVEQAKGMLASRAGISVADAFTRMRTHARNNGIPLTSVAGGVLDGTLQPRELAHGARS